MPFSNSGGKNSPFSLVVPLRDPVVGAEVFEDLLEVVARLEVVALQLVAAVEVYVVLPAVPGKWFGFILGLLC